jgi:hypothetical protein
MCAVECLRNSALRASNYVSNLILCESGLYYKFNGTRLDQQLLICKHVFYCSLLVYNHQYSLYGDLLFTHFNLKQTTTPTWQIKAVYRKLILFWFLIQLSYTHLALTRKRVSGLRCRYPKKKIIIKKKKWSNYKKINKTIEYKIKQISKYKQNEKSNKQSSL